MQLFTSIHAMLDQLEDVLEQVNDRAFTQRLPVLSGATIGQHTRHILEFFIELDKGYTTGIVCYDKRERDNSIEQDRQVAINALRSVSKMVERADRHLILQAAENQLSVSTNYYRELVYNIEHAVHHMAILRIGIESSVGIPLPAAFGVAASTIKYRNECVQ